ncbi:hypothetical protein A2V80_01080 [Candidatus Woesebacteria bacterium RBG_16_39_8b]|uniref:PIN domain-containing protein n=1 Tax=Candidatus Woesebacteria bacterium RBG_16_39_8b TaxID=1802482 RepID=A0A1F7XEJ1_9BACT|nr:MAG: hypothetical protein A2V80_01080 [Candidatus Woesebacteria bacterium RBG_16_39_8b]
MVKVLIDSSVIVDYTRAGIGALPQILLLKTARKAEVYIPTTVILELWAGDSMTEESEVVKVNRLLAPLKIVDLTKQIAKKAGELVRLGQIDSFQDAAIAAIALYLGAQLATQNRKHFEKVRDLKIFKD